jgi:hypothetical protein
VSDLERTRQNNWLLCRSISEYHQAVQAVLTFTKSYLMDGGDTTKIPEEWNKLDSIRQEKYAAMIAAAGLK